MAIRKIKITTMWMADLASVLHFWMNYLGFLVNNYILNIAVAQKQKGSNIAVLECNWRFFFFLSLEHFGFLLKSNGTDLMTKSEFYKYFYSELP